MLSLINFCKEMLIVEKEICSKLPSNVTFKLCNESNIITFKGPLGESSFHVNKIVDISVNKDFLIEINITYKKNTYNRFKKFVKSLFGLYIALINNAITGVLTGFKATLELRGLGYKVEKKDNTLSFNIGFSHVKCLEIPSDLSISIELKNIIYITGCTKQRVFWFAHKIKALRRPNIYKGFGIFFKNEYLNLKEVNKK